uniref:Uncharacterized protein n=1 Tax=Moniliophthora roreri TaxID=221103 RepID=A0A0W0G3C5_MONRR
MKGRANISAPQQSLWTTVHANAHMRQRTDLYWLREGWNEAGEGGRTVVEQGGRYQDPFSIPSDAYATHRRRRYPRIAAISRNATSAKVNGYSPIQQRRSQQKAPLGVSRVPEHEYDVAEDQRRRIYIDLNGVKTPSSYPRFRSQTPAPKYAGPFVPAFFWAVVYHLLLPTPLPTHFPSHPGLLAASVNRGSDEFVAAVVPEAIEASLDANFAAVATSCKVDTARVYTSTMEASCSYADTTIVFGSLENLRTLILESLGAAVIVEPASRQMELQERRKELEEGGSTAGEWDTRSRLPGSFHLVSDTYAIRRHRGNA